MPAPPYRLNCFFFLSIALWAPLCRGAAPTVAELQRQLATARPEEEATILLRLSERTETSDTLASIAYAARAQAAARTQKESLDALARVASLHRALGDYPAAISSAQAGLAQAVALKDAALRARFLLVIGRAQWGLSELSNSIATFQTLLPIVESLHDTALEIDARLGLGVVYGEAGQAPEAKKEFLTTLAMAESRNDPERIANSLTDLGNNYFNDGDLAQAGAYHQRALQVYTGEGDDRGMATAAINLGSVAQLRGDLTAAERDFENARATYARLGLKRQLANAERQLGIVFTQQGRVDEAVAQIQSSLDLARQIGSHTVLANGYLELAKAEEKRGRFQEALEAQRKYAAEHEAALGETTRAQLAELNARYDAARKEREIAGLRSDQAAHEAASLRQRSRAYATIAALACGLILTGAMVVRQRLKLMTERRVSAEAHAAREAAEQADRVKTRLLGIASHDLKGPLGNIEQIAAQLSGEQLRSGPVDERLEWITEESTRLMRLVQDLLDTAALESGRLELKRARVDLVEVLDRVVAEQRWPMKEKSQSVDWREPAAGTGLIEGDRDRLHQVFGNLLSNAVKFAPKQSVVALTVARDAGWVRVTVRDQGPGFSAEDRESLFTPYSRLTAQPTGREISHGLGLSIAFEIVRLHGGRIFLDSPPGAGAEFRIEFPGI